MNSKLHINLNLGLIEVEGSEELVIKIYDDFKKQFFEASIQSKPDNKSQNVKTKTKIGNDAASNQKEDKKVLPSSTVKSSSSSGPDTYTLNKELNLYSEGDSPSLSDFMLKYKATNIAERFVLIVHYLKNVKGIEKVGINEIYTCLKHLKIPIPNIHQGIRDTVSKKGWFLKSSKIDLVISTIGENVIDHELPINKEE